MHIYIYIYIYFAVFRKMVNIINIYLIHIVYWNILSSFMMNIWYYKCLLQPSGDIKLNPRPKPNSCKNFSICHWNLNSITSHKFIKVPLLTAYNSIHKFDIVCLSEMYLNSEKLSNDKNLNVPGYILLELTIIYQKPSVGEFASLQGITTIKII